MHSKVSQPIRRCPQSLRKRDRSEKPRNLLQSDNQCPGAPLSHLRKIPSATRGSNKGVKIVRKALSGAIARHSGDGKIYVMPHNEARYPNIHGQGLTSDTSFEPIRESDPRKF